jgi:hypothetical protein
MKPGRHRAEDITPGEPLPHRPVAEPVTEATEDRRATDRALCEGCGSTGMHHGDCPVGAADAAADRAEGGAS